MLLLYKFNSYLLGPTTDGLFGSFQDRGTATINRKRHWLLEQKLLHFVDAFHQYVMDRVILSQLAQPYIYLSLTRGLVCRYITVRGVNSVKVWQQLDLWTKSLKNTMPTCYRFRSNALLYQTNWFITISFSLLLLSKLLMLSQMKLPFSQSHFSSHNKKQLKHNQWPDIEPYLIS